MHKILFTQRGNRILALSFWAAVLGVWVLLHVAGLSPLGMFGLKDGCIIRGATGYSCWSCGLTRMLDSLIRFDFFGALRYNPYFFLILLLALLYAACFTIHAFRRKYRGPLFPRPKIWHAAAFGVSLIIFTILRNTPLYLSLFYV